MSSIYGDLGNPRDNGCTIRLLTVKPAANIHDNIICELEEVSLLKAPNYQSLSYCWGDVIPTRPIQCNETPINVTENLFSALQHLRDFEKHRTFWIDAVCINQNDSAERSSQILLIRDIFQRSTSVMIWLGPASADSSLAFQTLKQYHLAVPEVMSRYATDPMGIVDYASMKRFPYRISAEGYPQAQRPKHQNRRYRLKRNQRAALRSIMERPYFTRLWVMQELCCAREPIVKCGAEMMAWDAFRDSFVVALSVGGLIRQIGHPPWLWCSIRLSQLRHHHQATNQVPSTQSEVLNPIEFIAESHHSQTAGSGSNIIPFLELSSNLSCARKHDKIYGMLGLAQPPLQIEPNYKKPLRECYKEVTLAILKQRGNLDMFSACSAQMFQNEKTLSNEKSMPNEKPLPSWVPDFNLDHLQWYLEDTGPGCPFKEHLTLSITAYHHWLLPQFAGTSQDFSASGPDSRPKFRPLDGEVLELVGHVVDEVVSVGPDIWGYFDVDHKQSERLFGRETSQLDLRERFKKLTQHCLRSGNFADAVMQWEDIASQIPGKSTQEELLILLRVLQQTHPSQDMEPLLKVYNAAWRRLLSRIRRIQALKIFGARRMSPNVYNVVAGLVSYASLRLSRNKAHFLPFHIPGMSMHRIAKTRNGRLAYVSVHTRENDCIVLLKGGKTPFVARRFGDKWKLVGDCYVDGLMLGEGWSESAAKPLRFT